MTANSLTIGAYAAVAIAVATICVYAGRRHRARSQGPAYKTGYEWEVETGVMVVDPSAWSKRGLNYASSQITLEQHVEYAKESGCRHRQRQLTDIFTA